MQQYKDTIQFVKENGVMRGDRTGVGRHGVFSPPDEIYNLQEGFPLPTLRAIKPDAMVDELIWFISGSTTSSDLKFKFFWDKWTTKKEDAIKYAREVLGIVCDSDEEYEALVSDEVKARVGTIGNLYGVSWRHAPAPKGDKLPERQIRDYPRALVESCIPVDHTGNPVVSYESILEIMDTPVAGILDELRESIRIDLHNKYWSKYDQLNELIYKIKKNPNSSRLRVTAYLTDYMAFEEFSPQENVMDGRAALTACHTFFQCFVNPAKEEGGKATLDLKLTLTSSDVPVGRVYNIAQYALLCHLLAHTCDLDVGRLIISTGDAHIYSNQFEAVDEILSREPKKLPTLWLNPEKKDIFDFTAEDIKILNYDPHPAVTIPVAI